MKRWSQFWNFSFSLFFVVKKKRRLAFIFLTNQRARVFCSCRCCCCCLNRGIDSKNDVVNEDCYQKKRFLFFVLPSSQITHIRKRRIYLFVGCGRVLQNANISPGIPLVLRRRPYDPKCEHFNWNSPDYEAACAPMLQNVKNNNRNSVDSGTLGTRYTKPHAIWIGGCGAMSK